MQAFGIPGATRAVFHEWAFSSHKVLRGHERRTCPAPLKHLVSYKGTSGGGVTALHGRLGETCIPKLAQFKNGNKPNVYVH